MTLDEFRRQRVFVQHGQRAPHKALALLYAMGRLQGGERMTGYQDGAAAIAALLERFGPRRDVQRPSQPIWRLRPRGANAAAIWEVQIEGAAQLPESDNPPEAMLSSRGSYGLSADAAALFRQDPDALAIAAGEIADSIMPDTRRDELLAAVFGEQGLPSGQDPAPDSPTALQPHRRGSQKKTRSAMKRSPTKRHRRELESKLPTTQRDRPMKPRPLPSMRFRLRQATPCNSCENWLSWHSLSPATGERPVSDPVRSSGP